MAKPPHKSVIRRYCTWFWGGTIIRSQKLHDPHHTPSTGKRHSIAYPCRDSTTPHGGMASCERTGIQATTLGVVKARQTADGIAPDLLQLPTPSGRPTMCL